MAEVRYIVKGLIKAPLETVFDYRLDLGRLAEYNPNVTNLQRTDGGTEPGPGAEYLFDLTIDGMGTMQTPMRLVSADRPHEMVLDVGPNYMARETCSFEERDGGTWVVFDTTLTIDGEIDQATSDLLAESGSAQVRLEFGNMAKILEGRA